MNFRFDVTQRCYSLDSCYAGKASYASWLALKESTRIAFYTANQCQGEHVTVSTAPRGSLKFAEVGFDKSVYSFMLLETGAYPISGFLDICHGNENTRLNTTNSTESGLLADGSDLMIATFDTSEDAGDN
ncbi:hypothetical protein F441_14755 [Phytophthora nicotianae CJ01A1]|uniref:Uncharacterized protein n=4 Tax=Phytophthora nicotianae TaxID=4792 RepID=W2PSU0_PHYN3|nr:hypothetical protein PPTG_15374 [Phytophthora nicotianae INRA-310]ETN04012.1 hypothetical protein PPTG_15374 [Phytophthora nicotianae INRA-310]ETO68220.1 hypothetical protein F444_14926 [Phytophthora nicotianae P1976]ETP09384.1 hypothetical protein F441_14755 [Phytophthora nicotianae CJ01A1]KUF85551.1 hypothetical protein AM587_10007663 [Phytophthora nicotianae]